MVCYRVRSQSFFSWRLHPKSSLRASAHASVSDQASESPLAWHGNILCDHPAKPSSSYQTDVPLGLFPRDPRHNRGLSKVRRDRDLGHDRCNHLCLRLSPFVCYHRVTQRVSSPRASQSSTAAKYTVMPRTAAHNSRAFPREPQTKQLYRPNRTFTENERLRRLADLCTGQAPRHWSPHRTLGSKRSSCSTSRMAIVSGGRGLSHFGGQGSVWSAGVGGGRAVVKWRPDGAAISLEGGGRRMRRWI